MLQASFQQRPIFSFPKREALLISLGFVLFKLGVFLVAYFTVKTQGSVPNVCAWDCGYYREIATEGYRWKGEVHGTLAFFPLFPLLNRILMGLLPFLSFEASGITLNLFLFGTFSYLFMLWSYEVGMRPYWLPALILALDRYSIWAIIPYTEPLFLNLIMIFLLTQRRWGQSPKGLLLSSLIGGFASATRIVGVALVAALGLANFRYFLKRPVLGLFCLLLGLGGVIAYFSYIHVALGSWDMSLKTTASWNRKFSFLGFFNSLYYLVKQFYFPTILGFGLSVWAILSPPRELDLRPVERFLMAWLIFIPMANTIPVGISRYLSVLIFGPLMMAYLYERVRWKSLRYAFIAIFAFEIYWQVYLLMKFQRQEVFSWAA